MAYEYLQGMGAAGRIGATLQARDPTGKKSDVEKFKTLSLDEQVRKLAEIYAFKRHINAKPYEEASPEAAEIAFAKVPDVIFVKLKLTADNQPRFILRPSVSQSTYYKDLYGLLPTEKKVELLTYLRSKGNEEVFDHFAQVDPTAAAMVPSVPSVDISQEMTEQELFVAPETQPGMPLWGWIGIGVGGVALLSLLGWVSFKK